ncbi:MAG: RDD family protein [Bacteroidales bacterium]
MDLKSSRKRRIAAFLIDHFVMTFLMVALIFVIQGASFFEDNDLESIQSVMLTVMIPGMVLYFAKDSINGVSIGKWIMGIVVKSDDVDFSNPSFWKLFTRNIFIIIWPVEFIVLAISQDKKRIGDSVCKTVVLQNPNQSKLIYRVFAFIGIGAFFYLFTYEILIKKQIMNSESYKAGISGIQKNKTINDEVGGVEDFGSFPNAQFTTENEHSTAKYIIKVIGRKKSITVNVLLERDKNRNWQVINIEY